MAGNAVELPHDDVAQAARHGKNDIASQTARAAQFERLDVDRPMDFQTGSLAKLQGIVDCRAGC